MENNEYRISLKTYEGPMDLLIDLIKKNEIDIYDIPIHIITEQFLEYIEEANKINLELTSEFIVMASTLIEIKSKMLLPKIEIIEEEIEEEDPRNDLVQKIIEYEKYKEISIKLKESATYESMAFYKLREDFSSIDETEFLKNLNVDALTKSLKNMVKRIKSENTVSSIETEFFSVEKATILIKEKLEEQKSFLFSELLSENCYIEEIVSYFLSVLELVKLGLIFADQHEDFQDIKISERENLFD